MLKELVNKQFSQMDKCKFVIINFNINVDTNLIFRAYPVYTVGESGTMYQTGQTHYYTPSTNSYSQVNVSINSGLLLL